VFWWFFKYLLVSSTYDEIVFSLHFLNYRFISFFIGFCLLYVFLMDNIKEKKVVVAVKQTEDLGRYRNRAAALVKRKIWINKYEWCMDTLLFLGATLMTFRVFVIHFKVSIVLVLLWKNYFSFIFIFLFLVYAGIYICCIFRILYLANKVQRIYKKKYEKSI